MNTKTQTQHTQTRSQDSSKNGLYPVGILSDVIEGSSASIQTPLEFVGMDQIEVFVRAPVGGETVLIPAHVCVGVDLIAPEAKGIHLSRLYRVVSEYLSTSTLSPQLINETLKKCVESQPEMSGSASIALKFGLPLQKPSLKSGLKGLRIYPVEVHAKKESQTTQLEIRLEILYSSTCPCSAALARQLIQEKFRSDFKQFDTIPFDSMLEWLGREESICATPHSQRSKANVWIKTESDRFEFSNWVELLEECLKTPVQTAVKREDEQEFARLNGANLMFCEDAARKIHSTMSRQDHVSDFKIVVRHLESLHPHDAMAASVKGLEGGYTT